MKARKKTLISLSLCIVLVFCMAIPASARASAYFDATSISATSIGNGSLRIRAYTLATGTMQEVGCSKITVYEKNSSGNYESVFTFSRSAYPELIQKNRISNLVYLTYYGSPGKSYYILCAFYAKNANGSQTLWNSSSIVNT